MAEPEIPGFDHVRLLGTGRFGEVHLFQQRFPRRLVAVKVLRDQLGWDGRHAFELEANALAALSSHPCIVAIYDAGRSPDGFSYIVMEYCPLPSLAQQIRSRPLPLQEALRLGVQLAGAVDTAHAHGVLHRDIKPANVLMTDYGAPQLADFGIASSDSNRNVVSGLTPAWASPELIRDPTKASVATDVYALAATVYTMLAGHAPHERAEGPNDVDAVIDRASSVVPRLAEGGPVDDVLARALSTDEHVRFRSARALGDALRDAERQLGFAPTTMVLIDPPRQESAEQTEAMAAVATMWSHATQQEQSAPAPRRRALVPALLAAVIAVIVAAIGTAIALNSGEPSSSPRAPITKSPPPLELDADYVNVPCDGSYIVALGTAEGTPEGEEKLAERLVGVTGAKYLKNAASCEEFDPRSAIGDLYQVYLGPFESFEEACTERADVQAASPNAFAYRSWVKHVEVGSKRRELCTCLVRPQDLPQLDVGQSPELAAANRPFVSDLEHFLWYVNINNADPPIDDGYYTEQVAEMVRAYEQQESMGVDGRVSPPVWEHVIEDYCDDG